MADHPEPDRVLDSVGWDENAYAMDYVKTRMQAPGFTGSITLQVLRGLVQQVDVSDVMPVRLLTSGKRRT